MYPDPGKHVWNAIRMILLFTLYSNAGSTAFAQENALPENCYPRTSYAIMLANTLGQTKQIGGTETRGNIMELYANPETRSWTLVLVLPGGLACEIGDGTNLEIVPQLPGA